MTPFDDRLGAAVAGRGPLCVGIDPHPELLTAWGLPVDPGGLERFALTAVTAVAGEVAVVKPQSAFFEAFGSPGVAVLERVIAAAQAAGALVLVDVKRGDIGSTMAAYAAAYLGDSSPLAGDAVTLSPYLGFGSLDPAIELAERTGRGVFVLARTSNPEGAQVQHAAGPDGRTVAQAVVDAAAARGVGVVVGANLGATGLDLSELRGPILAPGFGSQGGTVADLRAAFGANLPQVLASTSRAVLRHGPDPDALRSAVLNVRDSLAAML
ncbi:MAG TPA: orotidine-5'-phosphate decarboxylase [Actinophytocola sp.]|uniref:orotidine-5'-phosphate decarboxylase n=1 Tax=Actinophytocola sp. TaxID=1872138 RepID=UPI002DB7DFB9|nr:orotidine-5'-phosphate decarboxylase [Actinophytocola sp.]HEU5472812.1 orotidine-5'-phosphate decarboxylase [Actinophytocola sp.]